jgi:dihydrofolate reductase
MVTSYYTAASLDGFIATADHSLDWLLSRDVDEHGPQGPAMFIAAAGALAMGATTYQWVLDHHDGPWPYEVPCWVFTHRTFAEPDADVRFTTAPVEQVHAQMQEAAGDRNVWVVGGGDLVGQFHDAGLLDEIWVQFAPVTLGEGAPLLPRRVELELLEVDRNRELACAHYRVLR